VILVVVAATAVVDLVVIARRSRTL